ncbi:hypothetical protein HD553DRAFT_276491, partial [Filobasidium floriforme]|uniref:uncharacterized protein n=1 Tax=Filobasidium floriforme TaxID=5210 RepID=UPI001E8DF7E7
MDARAVRRLGENSWAPSPLSPQPSALEGNEVEDTHARAAAILAKVKFGKNLTPEQAARAEQLVRDHHRAFALDLAEVKACPHTVHTLKVLPDMPLTKKPFGRPLSMPELVAAKKQVEKLLAAGVIERCRPEEVKCVAPIVMAAK